MRGRRQAEACLSVVIRNQRDFTKMMMEVCTGVGMNESSTRGVITDGMAGAGGTRWRVLAAAVI